MVVRKFLYRIYIKLGSFFVSEDLWPGISKVVEECGELLQILGKLMAYPVGRYPDGQDLKVLVEEEIADLYAALDYFVEVNGLDNTTDRRCVKLKRFKEWVLSGIRRPPS